MDIRLSVPEGHSLDDHERKHALDAALESMTRVIDPMIRRKLVPLAATAIRGNKVRWQAEPPGQEHFDLPTTVLRRGWGDCDDLAPWHAASLRATGSDPGALAVVKKSGPNRWHAIVRRSDGAIDDPSLAAGMGRGRSSVVGGHGMIVGVAAPIWDPMHDARLALAAYPTRRGILARVDVPDHEGWSWSGLELAPTVSGALLGAIRKAREVAAEGDVDDDDDMKLAMLEDIISGVDPRELAEAMEQEEELDGDDADDAVEEAMVIGSFFDSLSNAVAPITRTVARAMRPITNVYDEVSPYTSALFPGSLAMRVFDPARAFAEEGDPLAAYKANLIPGAQSGRDVFERNPLGRMAYSPLQQAFGNIPGAAQWFEAAKPRTPGGAVAPGGMLSQFLPGCPAAGMQAPPLHPYMQPGVPMQQFPGGPQFLRF